MEYKRDSIQKYVYIMSSNGTIKIGVSENVDARLESLSLGNPDIKLEYALGPYKFAYTLEGMAHKQFDHYQVRPEWFSGVSPDKAKSTILSLVNEASDEYERRHKNEKPHTELNPIAAEMEASIQAIKDETLSIRKEKERLWDMTQNVLGIKCKSEYEDCIYRGVFRKSKSKLKRYYDGKNGVWKREKLPKNDLEKVKSVERMVVELSELGWDFDRMKSEIFNH